MKLVSFILGSEEYAFKIENVYEVRDIMKITPVPGTPEWLLGVINLRGNIVPVYDLRVRFNLQTGEKGAEKILITERGSMVKGFIVEKIRKIIDYTQELQNVPLEGSSMSEKVFDGVANTGNSLILVLNLIELEAMLGA